MLNRLPIIVRNKLSNPWEGLIFLCKWPLLLLMTTELILDWILNVDDFCLPPFFNFLVPTAIFVHLISKIFFYIDSVLYSHYSELLPDVIKAINSQDGTLWPNLVPHLKTETVVSTSYFKDLLLEISSTGEQSILTLHLKKGFAII